MGLGLPATTNFDWIARPKILYGLNKHRYLDSIYYCCKNCGAKFTGYNEDSMKLDANQLVDVFNYRLGNGYAIDDELYSFIISHSNKTTASIYDRLTLLATEKWINDGMFYYKAASLKKISNSKQACTDSGEKSQSTIDSFFVAGAPREDRLTKRYKGVQQTIVILFCSTGSPLWSIL